MSNEENVVLVHSFSFLCGLSYVKPCYTVKIAANFKCVGIAGKSHEFRRICNMNVACTRHTFEVACNFRHVQQSCNMVTSSSTHLSIILSQEYLLFVGWGAPSLAYVSHITRILLPCTTTTEFQVHSLAITSHNPMKSMKNKNKYLHTNDMPTKGNMYMAHV